MAAHNFIQFLSAVPARRSARWPRSFISCVTHQPDFIVSADYNPTLTGEDDKEDEEFRTYYYTKPSVTLAKSSQPASLGIDSAAAAAKVGTGSYQNLAEDETPTSLPATAVNARNAIAMIHFISLPPARRRA